VSLRRTTPSWRTTRARTAGPDLVLTLSGFRVRHQEFRTVEDPVVQTYIDDALERTPVNVWGPGRRQEAAQALLAAHLLEISPYGRDARLDKEGKTTYLAAREAMDLEQAPGAFCRTT